jgi:transcriptional regulator with XRE-family HTH domain
MIIGDRLRLLREQKRLSQYHLEQRTGLLRCYISRVENNHTTPSVETLEKLAQALGMPLYQFFYGGLEPPKPPRPTLDTKAHARDGWENQGKSARYLTRLRRYLSQMATADRTILMTIVSQLVKQKASAKSKIG